jgi:hypothetical protein
MKALANRLYRLEQRLVQTDYLHHPRNVMRIVVSGFAEQPGIGPDARCTRTLCPNGTLMECVKLDGDDETLSKDEIGQFVNGFPVTILGTGSE